MVTHAVEVDGDKAIRYVPAMRAASFCFTGVFGAGAAIYLGDN